MNGKTYKVNTTELKETPWGEIDKTELRNTVMEASNRASLVKKVYLRVESGWEDAPSEKLGYPVMELVDDTFYYNRYALSSAMAYAKQHDETEIISKLNKLYKQFDLSDDKEGEGEQMSTTKFEIEGREAWGDVIKQVQDHEGKDAYVDSVEKDHIIYTIDDVRYRVEADIEVGKDDKTVKAAIKWDTKKKDADQKMSLSDESDEKKMEEDTDDSKDEKDSEKMTDDEKMTVEQELVAEKEKTQALAKQLEEKDNIIMGQKAELEDLRKFKDNIEQEQVKAEVQQTMDTVKDSLTAETYKALQDEGILCDMSNIDAWKNKAKSMAFDASKDKIRKSQNGVWRMSAPKSVDTNSGSLWRATSN